MQIAFFDVLVNHWSTTNNFNNFLGCKLRHRRRVGDHEQKISHSLDPSVCSTNMTATPCQRNLWGLVTNQQMLTHDHSHTNFTINRIGDT